MKIKKDFKIARSIFLLFLIVTLNDSVFAVGLVRDQEYLSINEGEEACINYKVFNSLSQEVSVKASVSDELNSLVISGTSETKLIPGDTLPSSPALLEVCFQAPSDSCKTGKEYLGSVFITEVPSLLGGGSNSATSLSIAAPLSIIINCASQTTNYSNMIYLSIIVILLILIICFLVLKIKRNK